MQDYRDAMAECHEGKPCGDEAAERHDGIGTFSANKPKSKNQKGYLVPCKPNRMYGKWRTRDTYRIQIRVGLDKPGIHLLAADNEPTGMASLLEALSHRDSRCEVAPGSAAGYNKLAQR